MNHICLSHRYLKQQAPTKAHFQSESLFDCLVFACKLLWIKTFAKWQNVSLHPPAPAVFANGQILSCLWAASIRFQHIKLELKHAVHLKKHVVFGRKKMNAKPFQGRWMTWSNTDFHQVFTKIILFLYNTELFETCSHKSLTHLTQHSCISVTVYIQGYSCSPNVSWSMLQPRLDGITI